MGVKDQEGFPQTIGGKKVPVFFGGPLTFTPYCVYYNCMLYEGYALEDLKAEALYINDPQGSLSSQVEVANEAWEDEKALEAYLDLKQEEALYYQSGQG